VAGGVQKICHSSHDAVLDKLGRACLKFLLEGVHTDQNQECTNLLS